MENEKNKKRIDGGKIVTTLIITLSTAIVFLVVGYWAGTMQGEEDVATEAETSATAVISSTATTSVSTTASTISTADWKIYTNSEYGFSLTFNDKWKGYEVINRDSFTGSGKAMYDIYMPTTSKVWQSEKANYASMFVITIYDRIAYNKLLTEVNTESDDPSELSFSTKLAENADYVATVSYGQDYPQDLIDAGLDKNSQVIASTFQFVK